MELVAGRYDQSLATLVRASQFAARRVSFVGRSRF